MKKTIILTISLALGFLAQAQQDYRPWKDFDGDTLQYLKVNFEENSSRYVGQPFERVINDYELPLEDLAAIEEHDVRFVQLSYKNQSDQYVALVYKHEAFHIVVVHFTEPFVSMPGPGTKILPGGFWDPERDMHVVAMKMKDCIVSKIEVLTIFE